MVGRLPTTPIQRPGQTGPVSINNLRQPVINQRERTIKTIGGVDLAAVRHRTTLPISVDHLPAQPKLTPSGAAGSFVPSLRLVGQAGFANSAGLRSHVVTERTARMAGSAGTAL